MVFGICEVKIDLFCDFGEEDKLNCIGKNGCWKEFEV